MDRSICANTIFVHFVYQIGLCEMARWLSFTIGQHNLWLENLALLELRQYRILPLLVRKNFKPIKLLNYYAIASKLFPTHFDLNRRLTTYCIFWNGGKKVSCQQFVNFPFVRSKIFFFGIFDWMNGRMGLVVELSVFWTAPKLAWSYFSRKFTNFSTLLQRRYYLSQVYCGIELSRLCSWVAEIALVVKFLHNRHRLLGWNS